MKSDIPDKVVETLKEIGMTHQQAGWNCHGTYVLLHKALEKVAVHKGIVFNEPTILETNSEKKIVSLLVTGKMGDKLEWSIGEAAPSNNKNSYPYAMAEKRAKDRVILKLVGLHGDVYAEDEADAFKEVMPSDITGGTMDNGSNDIKGSTIKVNNGVPEPYPTPVQEEVKIIPKPIPPREFTTEERREMHETKMGDFDHWCQQQRTVSQLHAYFHDSKIILDEIKKHNPDLYKKAIDIFTKHEANLERKKNG
jgi:hypothetical protein